MAQASDQKVAANIAYLKAAVAYYAKLGVKVERVMTNNGSCNRSRVFARACKRVALRHIRTRPYTPQTNEKAERFIQTVLREWAYAKAYQRPPNAAPNCRSGYTATTGIDRMAVLARATRQQTRPDQEQSVE